MILSFRSIVVEPVQQAQQQLQASTDDDAAPTTGSAGRHRLSGAALDTPRLGELPAGEAQQLLHSLLQENRALRKENADLYALREALLRQQEAVTKHNERLIKQIEGKTTSVSFSLSHSWTKNALVFLHLGHSHR